MVIVDTQDSYALDKQCKTSHQESVSQIDLLDVHNFYAGESVTLIPEDLAGGDYIYILARTQITEDMEESKAAQHSMVIDAKSARPYLSKGFDPDEVITFRKKLINDVVSGAVAIDPAKSVGATLDDVEYQSYYHAAAMG